MSKIRSLLSSFYVKVTLTFIFSLLFISFLTTFLIYQFALDSQFKALRVRLMAIAQTIALMIDDQALLEVPLVPQAVNSTQFKVISEQLMRVKQANPIITYIYTMAKTDQEGIWQFIVDPVMPTKKQAERGLSSFPGDKYEAFRFPEMLKAFAGPSADTKLEVDEWGVTLSGYAPVRNRSGEAVAMLGIDMEADDVYALQQTVHRRAVLIFVLGIIVSLGLGSLISNRITRPIKKLLEGTRYIGAGHLNHKVEVKGFDEIGELGRSFNQMAKNLFEARRKTHDYFYRVMQALIRSLEAKDYYTKGHSDRVAEYCEKIARQIGLARVEVRLLKRAAELHDIGKLGVHEDILNKKGKLTEEEWEIIRKHPVVSEDILRPVAFDQRMLEIVRSHHERYDGKGYPDKLDGEKINIYSQVIAVADAYDAMISDRAYRKALSKEKALQELVNNSGTQFNPKIVEAFFAILE